MADTGKNKRFILMDIIIYVYNKIRHCLLFSPLLIVFSVYLEGMCREDSVFCFINYNYIFIYAETIIEYQPSYDNKIAKNVS